MLREDLEAAGIPYAVEGPDGPLFADFHALRHTYLTLLGRGGVDLRTAQELAGHSTPTLTARYTHRRLYDLAGAVEKLPAFLPGPQVGTETAALRATGTEGRESSTRQVSLTAPLTRPGDIGPHRAASFRTEEGREEVGTDRRNPRNDKPLGTSSHQEASPGIRVGEGTRTPDIQIHSLTL